MFIPIKVFLTIIPRGMSLRLWLANKYDRPNLMYRVIVCILPRTVKNAVVGPGTIDLGVTFQQGANGNYMTLPIDTEKGIKVLYDKIIKNESGFNAAAPGPTIAGQDLLGRESHKFLKLWIKRKRSNNIMWEPQPNGVGNYYIVNKPLAIYVIPYDSYATLTTDNVASCAWCGTLYYKDV